MFNFHVIRSWQWSDLVVVFLLYLVILGVPSLLAAIGVIRSFRQLQSRWIKLSLPLLGLSFGLAAGFFNIWEEDHQYWCNGDQRRWYGVFAILGEPGNEMADTYGGDWLSDEAWVYAADITFWNGVFWMIVALLMLLVLHLLPSPNLAPTTTRRLHFPFGTLAAFESNFCAQAAAQAAIVEAQR